MVSPFAMHQQQLAMLAQQQTLLMAAAAKSAGGDSKSSDNVMKGINFPTQNWPNIGFHVPGMMMPPGGQGQQADLQKLMQVLLVRKLTQFLIASSEFLIFSCFSPELRLQVWDRNIQEITLSSIQHPGK